MKLATEKEVAEFNARGVALLEQVAVPEGFTATVTHLKKDVFDAERTELMLTSEDVKIRVVFYPRELSTKHDLYVYDLGDGHVDFKSAGVWFTFDQRGISDSFYVKLDTDLPAFNALIQKQVARAREAIAKKESSVKIPGFPFQCYRSPQEVEEMKKKLSAGQEVTITPGGMGTGYVLTTKQPRGRMSHYDTRPAVPELKKFLGVNTLFLRSFDHD